MATFNNGIDEIVEAHMIKDLNHYLAIAMNVGDEETFIAVLAEYIELATHYQTNSVDLFDSAVNSFIDLSADEMEQSRDSMIKKLTA